MALMKAGLPTPRWTSPQPTRRSTKRKSLAWWREHEVKVRERAERREREETERIVTTARMKAEAERTRKEREAREAFANAAVDKAQRRARR